VCLLFLPVLCVAQYDNIVLRFFRTFEYLFAVEFGASDRALRAAHAVRAIHSKVKGVLPHHCYDEAEAEAEEAGHSHSHSPSPSHRSISRGVVAGAGAGVGWSAGHQYHAYDEHAALWVLATLTELSFTGCVRRCCYLLPATCCVLPAACCVLSQVGLLCSVVRCDVM
jgi:hypothetical protein